jgi:hypothetical protein
MYEAEGAGNLAKRLYEGILEQEEYPVEVTMDFTAFTAAKKRLRLPGWLPTEEEYRWALSIRETGEYKYDISDYVKKGVEPYFHTPIFYSKKAGAIIERYENSDHYREVDFEISAVRFGNTVWVSNPFELFTEYASRMIAGTKARSLWSIQLTYDGFGYYPTKQALQAEGYSAFILSSRVDPIKAGDILVKESISLADSLY